MNEKLKSLIVKPIDVTMNLIDEFTQPGKFIKYIILFIIGYDIFTIGSLGVINFAIEKSTEIVTVVAGLLKTNAWAIVVIALVYLGIKKQK